MTTSPSDETLIERRLRDTLRAVTDRDEHPDGLDEHSDYVVAIGPARYRGGPERTLSSARLLVAAAVVGVIALASGLVVSRRPGEPDRGLSTAVSAAADPTASSSTAARTPTTRTIPSTSAASATAIGRDADGYAYVLPQGLGSTVTYNGVSRAEVADGPIPGSPASVLPYLHGSVAAANDAIGSYLIKLTPGTRKVTTVGFSTGPDTSGLISVIAGTNADASVARLTNGPAQGDARALDARWQNGHAVSGRADTSATNGLTVHEISPVECVPPATVNGVQVGSPDSDALCVSHVIGTIDDVMVLITMQSVRRTGLDTLTVARNVQRANATTWTQATAGAATSPVVPVDAPQPAYGSFATYRPT